MAILRVWSGGDDSDGLSWATAIQSIDDVRVDESAVGSVIWFASDESETITATTLLSFVNSTAASPTILVSVDRSDDSYAPGAKLTVGAGADLTISGWLQSFGIDYDVNGDDFSIGVVGNTILFDNCSIGCDDLFRVATNEGTTTFSNCTLDLRDTTPAITIFTEGSAKFFNCVITHPNTSILMSVTTDSNVLYSFEDCDLSANTDLKIEP